MPYATPYGFAPYGFTVPIAWRALVVRTAVSDQSGIDVHLLFYCLGGIVFALTFLIYLFSAKSRFLPKQRTLNCFGSLCMAIASPAISLSAFCDNSIGIIAGVALAALGSCIVFLCWGDFFAGMPLRAATIYVFGSFGLSLMLVPLYPLVPNFVFITLICKGRSKRYIAETLFISENTVKAHTRNAYAKLDAHNKQDVLDMIGIK